jgi:hypothetical protein
MKTPITQSYSFLQPLFTLSLLGPNVSLSILFSNTLFVLPLTVGDQFYTIEKQHYIVILKMFSFRSLDKGHRNKMILN